MRNDFSQPRIFLKKKARRQYCVKFLNVISKQEKKIHLNIILTLFFKTRIFSKSLVHTPHQTLDIVSNP